MTEGFAAVPNWLFRDESVSLYAVMVYGALASHQGKGGVYPSRSTIAKEARCSVRKVADALNELEVLGLIVRTRRTNKSGQATSGYDLHPGGVLGPDEVGASGASTGEVEAQGALGGGISGQITPLIEEEPPNKNPQTPVSYAAEFWKVYPRRVARVAVDAKFKTLAKAGVDLEVVLAGARRFAADPNLPTEVRYIPLPMTWLNQGRWADDPLPDRGGPAVSAFERNLALVEQLEFGQEAAHG